MFVHITKFIWTHIILKISLFFLFLKHFTSTLFVNIFIYLTHHLFLKLIESYVVIVIALTHQNFFGLLVLERHAFSWAITLRSIFLYQNCIKAYSRYRRLFYRTLISTQQVSLLLAHLELLIETFLQNTCYRRYVNFWNLSWRRTTIHRGRIAFLLQRKTSLFLRNLFQSGPTVLILI